MLICHLANFVKSSERGSTELYYLLIADDSTVDSVRSVNQSNQIYIASYVAQANQMHVLAELGGVFTFTVSKVKQFCL